MTWDSYARTNRLEQSQWRYINEPHALAGLCTTGNTFVKVGTYALREDVVEMLERLRCLHP